MKNRNLTQNHKCKLFKIAVLSALTFCSPLIIWGSNTVNKISEKDILQSTITASGIVQDIKGNPIIGASIVITGTGKGVVTDMNGHFTITTNVDCILRISSIGYITRTIQLKGKKQLVIILKDDTNFLNEVVAIGYGKAKKGDLSAAVSSVENMEKLQERPVSNVSQMLQGQIPGVSVVSNGGHPGTEPTITIRGMGSPNGESPLYVVDGVPGAPFNMSDVTSITVLKDAASAAIYGAYAGSAGVILITTKQAKAGRPSIEYNGIFGISNSTNLPQSLNWEDEMHVRKYAYEDSKSTLPIGWSRINEDPVYGHTNTNWINEIFRTAAFSRHNIAISGGSEELSSRLSLELNNSDGTLVNTYNRQVIGRLNSQWKINQYVRFREDLSWRDIKIHDANTSSAESGVILAALMMPCNVFPYESDGSYMGTVPSTAEYITKYGQNYADIHGDAINPLRILNAPYDNNHTSTFTSSTFFDITQPVRGLNFTSRFTWKQTNYMQRYYNTKRLEAGKPSNINELKYASYREPQWNWENTITYDRLFGRHTLGLMASTTASQYSYRDFKTVARGFEDERASMFYFTNASNYLNPTDTYYKDRNLSFVGRASYSYANRYFFTTSVRRDYASRLPKGHKYGDFPSVTAAWKITSEPWIPKIDILNMLKIRASYGKIGNLGSIDYGYGTASLSSRYIGSGDVGNQIGINTPIAYGIYLRDAFNSELTWETSEQFDLGIDTSLLDNRLTFTFDYFNKNTKNLITTQSTNWPNTIGISAPLINDGEVNNRGAEISAMWKDKVNSNWTYYLEGNLATLRNRLTNIGAANPDGTKPVWTYDNTYFYKTLTPYRSAEGQPLYSYYVIRTDGVFKTDEEAAAYVDKRGNRIQPNAKAGDLKFIDLNGDGSIGDGDYEYRGNAMPKLTYAFSGGFSYKKFSFDFMFQGATGAKLFNAYKYTTLNESLSSFNRSAEILKALDGPNNTVPRISLSDPNNNFGTISDWYLESGSYLRLKNLSITYSFTDMLRKIHYFNTRKSSLDITLSCENMFTITPYSGIDPEVGGIGLDCGQYPVARTFSLAIKLKF
jgi:TonB-linked SusC/RagA family outer membrane protein